MRIATTTEAANPWPARLAFGAALIFTLASGGTNLTYGLAKGTDAASSAMWAAVSIGASIVFALSWPGLIVALDRRQWARVVMVLAALLLTGAYSVTAALGSAAGGRMNAAAIETASTGARDRAQAAYEAAKADLAKLAPSRPSAELEAMLAAAQRNPRTRGCAGHSASGKITCPKLEAELARARQRDKLQAALDRASEALTTGPAKVANSDAKALAGYLQALGIEADTESINRLLILLAVLMIECGGGLALAVGMALSGVTERAPKARPFGRSVVDRVAERERPNASPNASSGRVSQRSAAPNAPLQPGPDASDKSAATVRLLTFIGERGGVLASSQLQLARSLGWSKTWTHEVLHELAGRGLVKLDTRPTGTVVRLAA